MVRNEWQSACRYSFPSDPSLTSSNVLEDLMDPSPPGLVPAEAPPRRPGEPQPGHPSPSVTSPATSCSSDPNQPVSAHTTERPRAQHPSTSRAPTPELNINLPLRTEDLARLPRQGLSFGPGLHYDSASQMAHPIADNFEQNFGAGSASMSLADYGQLMRQLGLTGMTSANLGHAQPPPPPSPSQYLDMSGMLPDYVFANDMTSPWVGLQQPAFQ